MTTFPVIHHERVSDERLKRLIAALAVNDDLRLLLREVAAERLATLEALSAIDLADPSAPRHQGRADALAWLIGLFNKTDDEE